MKNQPQRERHIIETASLQRKEPPSRESSFPRSRYPGTSRPRTQFPGTRPVPGTRPSCGPVSWFTSSWGAPLKSLVAFRGACEAYGKRFTLAFFPFFRENVASSMVVYGGFSVYVYLNDMKILGWLNVWVLCVNGWFFFHKKISVGMNILCLLSVFRIEFVMKNYMIYDFNIKSVWIMIIKYTFLDKKEFLVYMHIFFI